MKKIILSLFLAISFTFTYAQKANVSKAKDKALMETPDFTGAREAIKLALQDETTKNLAETWYVAGLIGAKENESLYNKALINMPYDADGKGKAILESYQYFLEAIKLDQIPDAKGKVKLKYSKDIKTSLTDYYKVPQNLIGYGAYLYEKKDYEGAIKVFETYLSIPKLPLMNNEISMNDSSYCMIEYYAAVSASNGKNYAKAVGFLNDLKTDTYENVSVFQLLSEQYAALKDTVNYVKVLNEAFEKYPTEAWFLQNIINHLINTRKSVDALVYLKKAIDREPKMAQYRYVKGNLDESLGNYEDANNAFNSALELDPNIADAYAGKGRLLYNKAIRTLDAANNIKDAKLFNAEVTKADVLFKESMPFFKKATELNPKEVDYKTALKNLYYRLKMDADFEAIKKEIEAM